MKIVAAMFADFEESFLGGRSVLRERVGSDTVIGSALRRLSRVDGLSNLCLFVRPRDRDAAAETLSELQLSARIDLLAVDDGARPRRGLFRSARKWSLGSWRGGLLSATWFDEYVEPLAVARVVDHYSCDAALCLTAEQPLLDVTIASAMVAHQKQHEAEAPFVFTQAPPGLAGVVLGREVTRDLLTQSIPFGILLNYRPEIAQPDPLTRPMCLQIAPVVAQMQARLTADTRRSRELVAAVLRELGDDVDATRVCQWLRQPGRDRAGALPLEIEVELTSDDPLPNTTLRPRGARVPNRVLRRMDAVERIVRELAEYDDRLIVLGGHGDPLMHAEFASACEAIRAAGVCGLAVETTLIELSDDALEAMFRAKVDVVEVRLDAMAAETYTAVHGADRLGRVIANIDRIEQLRRERVSPPPLIVCSMTRSAATLGEVESFYDHWVQRLGSAIIRGYNEFGGLLPPDGLIGLTPPIRRPCRRLPSRLTLLANGGVPSCGQDSSGTTSLGDWFDQSLGEIWHGTTRRELLADHASLTLATRPLCAACGEWDRD